MREAAANLDFERAAELRDRIKGLKRREMGLWGRAGSRDANRLDSCCKSGNDMRTWTERRRSRPVLTPTGLSKE